MTALVGDYLDRITSKVKRKKFVTYDIESKKDDTQEAGFTRPFLVGFYDPETARYREFRNEPHLATRPWKNRQVEPGGCVDKFLTSFLTKRYEGSVAYAHNAGSFDALFMLPWLERHRDEFGFEVVPVASSIQVVRIWRLPDRPEDPIRQRWELLDSMKLLPMGLEKACTAMGVAGKKQHDLHMHEDDPTWTEYLEQDCRALAAVLERLYALVEQLGGEVGMTTPSTSVKLFRRRYLGTGGVQEMIPRYKHFPNCGKPASCEGCLHDFVRRGYYGGRTEIHAFYGERLSYFDFNSSYAASMNEDMPIGDMLIEEGVLEWSRHTSHGGRSTGFCECTVRIPKECPIPPLPYRHVETGKLVFPTGQFHGVWSLEELALLRDPLVGGEIVHVVKTVWYGLRPMFQDMVRDLYGYRDKSRADYDDGLSLIAKLLLNGGYGKFAMRSLRSTIVFAYQTCAHPHEPGEVALSQCFLCAEALPLDEKGHPIGGVCSGCEGSKPAYQEPDEDEVWYKMQRTDANYIIPQISAHITATARVRLWKAMRDVVSADAGERTPPSELRWGDVVLLGAGGKPAILVSDPKRDGKRRRWLLELRTEGADGRSSVVELAVRARDVVPLAGRIYYLDTDSIITNVTLPSSTELGALKNEYPGETLTVVAVQAKAYLVAKTPEWETYLNAVRARDDEPVEIPLSPDSDDAEVSLVAPPGKVTLKGFPREMRTPQSFERLRGLPLTKRSGVARRQTLRWKRLQKVRTLARSGFRAPPLMEDVSKSLQSDYDKRTPFEGNWTRAMFIHEPIGGPVDAPEIPIYVGDGGDELDIGSEEDLPF